MVFQHSGVRQHVAARRVHLIADHNPTSPAVSGSKRQGSPCTLGERPTATHPRELEYACSIFYCESPVPVCFIVQLSNSRHRARARAGYNHPTWSPQYFVLPPQR